MVLSRYSARPETVKPSKIGTRSWVPGFVANHERLGLESIEQHLATDELDALERAPMKFDAARVIETVDELGAARFTGRDGESRIADFVAERLTQLGWQVERRAVLGPVLPRLAVSSLGWWSLASLVTAATVVCWTSMPRWPVRALGSSLLILSALWAYLALSRGLRFGWNLPPVSEAPVVIAQPRSDRPPSCRVVLQTPLGALSAAPRDSLSGHSSIVSTILAGLLLSSGLMLVSVFSSEASTARLHLYARLLTIGLLGLVWVAAIAQTFKDLRLRDSRRVLDPSQRTGLAVLLEMARAWPNSPYQPDGPATDPKLAHTRPALGNRRSSWSLPRPAGRRSTLPAPRCVPQGFAGPR